MRLRNARGDTALAIVNGSKRMDEYLQTLDQLEKLGGPEWDMGTPGDAFWWASPGHQSALLLRRVINEDPYSPHWVSTQIRLALSTLYRVDGPASREERIAAFKKHLYSGGAQRLHPKLQRLGGSYAGAGVPLPDGQPATRCLGFLATCRHRREELQDRQGDREARRPRAPRSATRFATRWLDWKKEIDCPSRAQISPEIEKWPVADVTEAKKRNKPGASQSDETEKVRKRYVCSEELLQVPPGSTYKINEVGNLLHVIFYRTTVDNGNGTQDEDDADDQ